MPASPILMPEALKAADLYAQGYSLPQIAEVVGRSRKTVATGLRMLGHQPRSRTEGYRQWLRLRGSVGNRAKTA
jgi:AraC-like DNA-binding protein